MKTMPPPIVGPGLYVKTFAALLLLLAGSVAVNFLNLGAFSLAASLGISLVKAALIALYFMELRYSKPMTWLFAGAALAWLVILIGLTMNDYNTRRWSGQSWKDEGLHPLHMEFAAPRN